MARNKKVEILSHSGEVLHPITDGDCVIFPDGETLTHKLSEQEAVMYTPEVVNSSPMFKVGEGDTSDYSASVLDGAYQEAILKGQTYVNTIQEPSADEITLPTPFTEYERTQSKTFTEMQDGTFGLNLLGQSYVNCIQEPSEPSYVALGENLEFQNKKVEYTSDGQIKSAMLNGMTLVNWCTYSTKLVTLSRDYRMFNLISPNRTPLQQNKDYLIVVDVISLNTPVTTLGLRLQIGNTYITIADNRQVGLIKHKFNTGSNQNLNGNNLRLYTTTEDVADENFECSFRNVMILEYQEGLENIDIPYFQGMQSVTMTTELENVCSRYNSSVAKSGKTFTVSSADTRTLKLSPVANIGSYNFKQNTKYLLQFKIANLNLDGLDAITFYFSEGDISGGNALFGNLANANMSITKNGIYRVVLTTSNIIDTSGFVIKGIGSQWENTTSTSRTLTISQIMCIEYQNGMENWDLPYFETTQLMKPLKVRTMSKNLCPVGKGQFFNCFFKAGTQFTLSTKDGVASNGGNIVFKDKDGNSMWLGIDSGTSISRTTLAKDAYQIVNQLNSEAIQYQLEEGTSVTSFVPREEKTISALEPITLRAIGNVKDTLDLSTGEYVQRFDEVVLDGSSDESITMWFNKENNVYFGIGKINNVYKPRYEKLCMVCDKLPTPDVNPKQFEEGDYEGVSVWDDNFPIVIGINKNRLQGTTVSAFRQWLQQNPIKIQYRIVTTTRKISLEYPNLQTYQDITHVQSIAMDGTLIPNIYLPSDISYKAMLKPNTSYNVIVDREVIDSTNQLTVNLGGTTANITANRTVVRTPSTLSNETLTFSGKGNRIGKVMLIENSTLLDGDIPYFEGIGDVHLGRVVENLCVANEKFAGGGSVTGTYYNDRIELKITKAGSAVAYFPLTKQLKNGKKYFVYSPSITSNTTFIMMVSFKRTYNNSTSYAEQVADVPSSGKLIFTIDDKNTNPYDSIVFGNHGSIPVNTTMTIRRPIVCEYIDGMENWDWESIGYFTGTRNIGNEFMRIGNKNLFDGQIIQGAWNSDTDFVNSKNYVCTKNRILVKPNTTYTTSLNGIRIALTKLYIDEYFNLIKMEGNGTSTFTTPTNCKYLKLDYYKSEGVIPTDLQNLQLEEASSATSYIAHKHNSLHILPNEQIPLTFVQGTIAYAHNGTWENAINNTNTTRIRTQLLDLEPNETYRVSCGHSNHGFGCQGYDNSLLAKSDSGWTYDEYYFTTTKDVHKYAINVRYKDNSNITPSTLHQVRLEKVTDVTLRSVGNVKDELDLTRGVYIQRIGEIVLNGSENWVDITLSDTLKQTYNAYGTPLPLKGKQTYADTNKGVIDDKGYSRVIIDYANNGNYPGEAIAVHNNGNLYIRFNKGKGATKDEWKQYLTQNPITVQYVLATPIEHKINIPMKNEANQTIAKPNGVFTLPLMYSETNYVDINSQIYPKVQSRDYISYPVIANNSQLHTVFHNKLGTGNLTVNLCGTSVTSVDGTSKCTVTTPSTISQYELRLSGARNKVSNVCVFSGDYMNVDVPYVQGMMNAVNPTIKNIGKNLFSSKLTLGLWDRYNKCVVNNNNYFCSNDLIRVTPNTTLKISGTAFNTNASGNVMFYDKNKNYLGANKEVWVLNNAKIPSDTYYITFHFLVNPYLYDINGTLQIEESSTPSQYEPYKENICEPKNGVIKLTRDMFEQGTFNTTVTNVDYESRKENQTTRIRTKGLIPIKPNMTYSISVNKGYAIFIGGYDKNQKCLGSASSYTWANGRTFTATSDCHYICIAIRTDNNKNITPSDFNNAGIIVQKLEDIITLRSLPNGVRDELNLQTGEYIQRIGEVVLDGSEDEAWGQYTGGNGNIYYGTFAFKDVASMGDFGYQITICDKLKTPISNTPSGAENKYSLSPMSNKGKSGFTFSLNHTETVAEAKKWLQSNPIRVQYLLKTPIIKQIDINNFPHSYKDGHVIIESNDPSTNVSAQLTYQCVTNRSGQIQEHTEQVEKQERQINELETLILENIRMNQNRSQNFLTSLISTLEIEEE